MRRAVDTIRHPFIIKTLRKIEIEGKEHSKTNNKPIASIIFNDRKLDAFLLPLETRQNCPFSPFLLSIVPEFLAIATRKRK